MVTLEGWHLHGPQAKVNEGGGTLVLLVPAVTRLACDTHISAQLLIAGF